MNTATCHEQIGRSNTESWLAHIAEQLGAEAAVFTARYPDAKAHCVSIGHLESAIDRYREHFNALDPLPALLLSRPEQRSLAIDAKRHPAYRAQREFLHSFLLQNGVAYILGYSWQQGDGSQRLIQLHRLVGALPFMTKEGRELEKCVHHWRISEAKPTPPSFSALETHERRRGDIAAQLAIPLAVLDGGIKIIWANPAALQADDPAWKSLLQHQDRQTIPGRIRPEIYKLVRDSLNQHGKVEAVFTFAEDRHFAIVSPLSGQPGLSLLQMSDLNHEAPGIKARLQRLLKLSPAESELAVLLASGANLASIAKFRKVSQGTVRSQLQVIYRKTETHRQSELVSLIQGLSQH